MKRRSLLKMLGVSPALLVPWKPATEQIVTPPPSPSPEVVPAPPAKLSLEEALKLVDWDAMHLPKYPDLIIDQETGPLDMKPVAYARSTCPTATIGFNFTLQPGDDHGPV